MTNQYNQKKKITFVQILFLLNLNKREIKEACNFIKKRDSGTGVLL